MDKATEFLKRTTDILFLRNPEGTALGIILGFIFDMLKQLFLPILKDFTSLNFSGVHILHLIALGVFVVNFPTFIKRSKFSPEIEEAYKFIRQTDKDVNLSTSQLRMMHMRLFETVLSKINLNENQKEIFDSLSKAIATAENK